MAQPEVTHGQGLAQDVVRAGQQVQIGRGASHIENVLLVQDKAQRASRSSALQHPMAARRQMAQQENEAVHPRPGRRLARERYRHGHLRQRGNVDALR